MTTPASTPPAIGSGQEGSARDQIVGYFRTVRQGEVGALPAIAGFVVLMILFAILNPRQFLGAGNLANLITQSSSLTMLATALVFVILLGEIDLSAGVTSGLTAGIFVLMLTHGVPPVLAVVLALGIGVCIGAFIGFFVAFVGIPSFVVTLGLFLGFQGVQLLVTGGEVFNSPDWVKAITNSNLPIWLGWTLLAVAVVLAAAITFADRARRARAGAVNRPLVLAVARLVAIAAAGSLFVALMSIDRAASRGTLNGVPIPSRAIEGVPIVVPIAIAVLWIGTEVLDRTRYGRHLYAVGGNAEAARRTGIRVVGVRLLAFVVCSTLSVLAGVFEAGRVGTVSAASGNAIVLSGVAAVVVGGVSLFGGRGRLVHAAIGALVISVIANGLGLVKDLDAGWTFAATGAVLILAATVDAVSRRRSGGSLLRR